MRQSPEVCQIVLLVLTLFHAGLGHGQPSGPWRDPSPHQVRGVTVEPGVRLEVLDWGGSERPLVLLAGLGMTAHVFDGFAEKLTGSSHVYGITRRGYSASSRPASGYTEDRLVEDDLRVLDALNLAQPVMAGHSVAGNELSELGIHHYGRIGGLVYLDALNDGADDYTEYDALCSKLPEAMRGPPTPSPSDLKSFPVYGDGRMRTDGTQFPRRNGAITLPKIQTGVSANASPRTLFRRRLWPAATNTDTIIPRFKYPCLPSSEIRDFLRTGSEPIT